MFLILTKIQQFRPVYIRVFVFAFILFGVGCVTQPKVSKEGRESQKKQAALELEFRKEYEQKVEDHYKSQSSETKKMMKKMGKINNRNMQFRRHSWLSNIF